MGGNGARSGLAFEGKACGSKCKYYGASCSISSLVVRQGTGCHPRHPPRAFPLGLLAPRCLGSLRFLASIACGLSGSGRHLFGGRKESSPQLRAPPCSGMREYSVPCRLCGSSRVCLSLERAFGVRPRTNPLHVFNSSFVVSLPLLNFCIAIERRRSSVALTP